MKVHENLQRTQAIAKATVSSPQSVVKALLVKITLAYLIEHRELRGAYLKLPPLLTSIHGTGRVSA